MKKKYFLILLVLLAASIFLAFKYVGSHSLDRKAGGNATFYNLIPELFVGIIQEANGTAELKILNNKKDYNYTVSKEQKKIVGMFSSGFKEAGFDEGNIEISIRFFPPAKFFDEDSKGEKANRIIYPEEFLDVKKKLEIYIEEYNKSNKGANLSLKLYSLESSDPDDWLKSGDIILNIIPVDVLYNPSATTALNINNPKRYIAIRRYKTNFRPHNTYSTLKKKHNQVFIETHVCEYQSPMPDFSEIKNCLQILNFKKEVLK